MATISFYFDEMMNRPAAEALNNAGYIVVMANDVGMTEKPDPEHLKYATENNLVLVTLDREFAGLAQKQFDHTGLICFTEEFQDVGGILRALSQFADEHEAGDVAGQVFWLKSIRLSDATMRKGCARKKFRPRWRGAFGVRSTEGQKSELQNY
jgi:hypothetical protein